MSLRTAIVFLLAVPAIAQPTPADRTQIIKLVDANAARIQTSLQRDLGLRRARLPREQKLHPPPGPTQKSRLLHPIRSGRRTHRLRRLLRLRQTRHRHPRRVRRAPRSLPASHRHSRSRRQRSPRPRLRTQSPRLRCGPRRRRHQKTSWPSTTSPAPSATTARPPKKAAPARSTWSAPASSKT